MKHEVVYGVHAIAALLEKRPEAIREVWVMQGCSNKRVLELVEQVRALGVAPQAVRKAVLEKQTGSQAHQGIAAKVNARPVLSEADLYHFLAEHDPRESRPLFLILDALDDPQNLGACLRSAECAGVAGVIITRDKTPSLATPSVRKVACGAVDLLPVYQVTNLASVLKRLKDEGVWIVGTACDERAQSLYETELTGAIGLVLGSEGKGLRRLTLEQCDFVSYIPLAGSIDSLNVSVATGVALFEARRQRLLAEAAQPA